VQGSTCGSDSSDERFIVLGPLLALIIGVAVWKLLAAGQAFVPAFAGLLSGATVKRGMFNVLSGRSYATGQFRGHDVAIRLQLRRGEYQVGYLVIAVRTAGPEKLDYNGIEAHTRDESGKQALFIIASNDLLLTVEDGWLKTMWQPVGFTTFPGRFSEERWRPVLEAMQTVATSLEAAA
jgi:hypothetical protein